MSSLIVSSTEPTPFRTLLPDATFSTVPEKYGVDFYWIGAEKKKCGVQRKEVKDFLQSVEDGRLSKELGQMGALDLACVVVEGKWEFTTEGRLILNRNDRGQRYTKKQLFGLLWSLQYYNVWVGHTLSMQDTAEYVTNLHDWTLKGDHDGLKRRPNPKPLFGSDMTDREWGVWLMQGLPGVGPKLANRIWEMHGNIMGCRVDKAELMNVEGVGKVLADGILQAVGEIKAKGMMDGI